MMVIDSLRVDLSRNWTTVQKSRQFNLNLHLYSSQMVGDHMISTPSIRRCLNSRIDIEVVVAFILILGKSSISGDPWLRFLKRLDQQLDNVSTPSTVVSLIKSRRNVLHPVDSCAHILHISQLRSTLSSLISFFKAKLVVVRNERLLLSMRWQATRRLFLVASIPNQQLYWVNTNTMLPFTNLYFLWRPNRVRQKMYFLQPPVYRGHYQTNHLSISIYCCF
ncbi:uncharacterized protein PHALS_15495 [Plasmopara halstedii]|uniref:Uncharacterized protein n=1 Tax=Plasmopara halstedii TaxID=4781 RepID=A0A0P1AUZ2_PLAHL|nr:uncharacterized protein PHALS_15495 [Plasmopara halstedii]CEG44826.1 hypothetical protein PHALS_15495 [Plasmopara halstedii]|eukprot:XP_024581195.1 hypothetical protein PHALS_15495 [Plasmopara halstedii]